MIRDFSLVKRTVSQVMLPLVPAEGLTCGPLAQHGPVSLPPEMTSKESCSSLSAYPQIASEMNVETFDCRWKKMNVGSVASCRCRRHRTRSQVTCWSHDDFHPCPCPWQDTETVCHPHCHDVSQSPPCDQHQQHHQPYYHHHHLISTTITQAKNSASNQ